METTDPEVSYLESMYLGHFNQIRIELDARDRAGQGRLPAMSQLAAEAAALVVSNTAED